MVVGLHFFTLLPNYSNYRESVIDLLLMARLVLIRDSFLFIGTIKFKLMGSFLLV